MCFVFLFVEDYDDNRFVVDVVVISCGRARIFEIPSESSFDRPSVRSFVCLSTHQTVIVLSRTQENQTVLSGTRLPEIHADHTEKFTRSVFRYWNH